MGREVRLFKSEERMQRDGIATFMRQLADKIDQGQVTLRQGTEEIMLELPHNLILDVQVEDENKRRQGTQHSLEIEIKWFDGETATGALELA